MQIRYSIHYRAMKSMPEEKEQNSTKTMLSVVILLLYICYVLGHNCSQPFYYYFQMEFFIY